MMSQETIDVEDQEAEMSFWDFRDGAVERKTIRRLGVIRSGFFGGGLQDPRAILQVSIRTSERKQRKLQSHGVNLQMTN